MVGAEQDAHDVRDDQSDKADDACGVDCAADQQRGDEQIGKPSAVQIDAQRERGVVTEQHEVERAELTPEKEQSEQADDQNGNVGRPFGTGQTAHCPAHERLGGVGACRQVEQEVGEGHAHRRQRGTGEQQLDRVGASAEVCQCDHGDRHGECTDEGQHAGRVCAEQTGAHTGQNGEGSAERRARGHAEYIGVG